jgi:hypothetical protein
MQLPLAFLFLNLRKLELPCPDAVAGLVAGVLEVAKSDKGQGEHNFDAMFLWIAGFVALIAISIFIYTKWRNSTRAHDDAAASLLADFDSRQLVDDDVAKYNRMEFSKAQRKFEHLKAKDQVQLHELMAELTRRAMLVIEVHLLLKKYAHDRSYHNCHHHHHHNHHYHIIFLSFILFVRCVFVFIFLTGKFRDTSARSKNAIKNISLIVIVIVPSPHCWEDQ